MADNLNAKAIDELADLVEAFDVIEKFNLDCEKIENLGDAQRALRLHLHSKEKDDSKESCDSTATNDAYTITVETSTRLMESDKTVTKKLQTVVKKCCSLIKKLPSEKSEELSITYPAALSTMNDIVNQLESNPFVILVAGETGAGKSTFLNLLLGELSSDLLPVAHLSSTSAICELKYSEDKMLHVYPIDSKEIAKSIKLGDNAAETISEYIHQKRRGDCLGDNTPKFAYSRVVLYWPCEWLKGGITIVDSPGVGEDDELTALVKQYIPKAFGFIYMINTPNAGGIDPDRLQHLLFSHLAGQKNADVGQANPRSAIFVCNKWDNVPSAEREEVKTYVMSKLHETWPGFVEDQVFFFSATKAIEQMGDGLVSADYRELLRGLERLIPVGLRNKLCSQYLKVSRIMERYNLILTAHISNTCRDAKQSDNEIEKATACLQKLAAETEMLKRKLDEQRKDLTNKSLQNLKDHLLDKMILKLLCAWSPNDCQSLKKFPPEILAEKMRDGIFKRIKMAINKWDAKFGVLEHNHKELSAIFQNKFQSIETERRVIEQIFANMKTENKNTDEMAARQKKEFLGFNVFAIGQSASLWVPIGILIGLFALPIAGNNQRQREEMDTLDAVKSNIEQQMADLTKTMVEELVNSKDLENIIEEGMKEPMSVFHGLLAEVSRLIKSDTKMIDNIKAHRRDDERKITEVYEPLEAEAREITSKLNHMYVKYCKHDDAECTDKSD